MLFKDTLRINLGEGINWATEHKGREAVINGQKKIKRAGGYHSNGKFYVNSKEVGHTFDGRDYFDSDLIDKHGFMRLTNAHMDM